MKEIKPYVGITGFKTPEDVERVTNQYKEHGLPKGYTAMYGILTSEKRLRYPWRDGTRSPAVVKLSEICSKVPKNSLGLLHYHQTHKNASGKYILHTEAISGLIEESNADGIQFNIPWPDVQSVSEISKYHIVVLQLSQRAIEGITDKEIESRLKEYQGIVQYGLVDLSEGQGIELNISRSNDLISLVKESLPNTLPVIAGGLNPQNLASKLNSLEHKNLSFDAESGLMPYRVMLPELTNEYIKEASRL